MSQKIAALRLTIPDVMLITPVKFGDARGFFFETYDVAALRALGLEATFVQDNHSLSAQKGIIRDLHFQSPPHAQGKLVRVERMGRGFAWFDTGTPDSMLDAANYGATIEKRQGTKIASPEEIAVREGFIGMEDLERLISERYAKNDCGAYLNAVLADLKSG